MTTVVSIILYLIAVALAAGCGAQLEEKKGTKTEKEVVPGLVLTLIIFLIAAALQVFA